MTTKTRAPMTALLLATLAASSALPLPAGQEGPEGSQTRVETERRVMVVRGEGGHGINLEAVGGNRAFLGVGLLDLTAELRDHFGVPTDRGIMISKIVAGSPAQRAGLLPADILTAVDGEPLPASIDFSIRVASAADGEELELERWREGRKDLLRVAVESRPRSQLDISPLLVKRVEFKPGHRIEIEARGGPEADHRWIEKVVETVGDSFAEATFIEQLEALRRERKWLLDKLQQMEVRLEELEGELHLLDSDSR